MKGLFVIFAFLTYAGMAVYSLGTLKTRASSSAAKPAFSLATKAEPRITLVTANLAVLADFYNEVFGAELRPLDQSATPSYQGDLGGRLLVLSPKQNARGKQQRQRMSVEVSDIAKTLTRVATNGGTVDGKVLETATEKRLVVRDPDGNPIELTQLKD
jgi:predicted enzyme related to lactoylglutathione lyase